MGARSLDPRSGNELVEHPEWSEAVQMLEQLTVLDERVQVESFDAVFLPGGYGVMFDLQDNPLRAPAGGFRCLGTGSWRPCATGRSPS